LTARPARGLYIVVVVLVGLLVIVSTIAGLYYYQYSQAEAQNSTYVTELNRANVRYLSNIFVDYGNGTKHWYNVTNVEPGTNLYVETEVVSGGNVNSTYYPQYQSHLVTAINGVGNTNSLYWLLWTYNRTSMWQEAASGPDLLPVSNNSIFAWSYCGANCTQP
jgi:hypothetical protein